MDELGAYSWSQVHISKPDEDGVRTIKVEGRGAIETKTIELGPDEGLRITTDFEATARGENEDHLGLKTDEETTVTETNRNP